MADVVIIRPLSDGEQMAMLSRCAEKDCKIYKYGVATGGCPLNICQSRHILEWRKCWKEFTDLHRSE